MSYSSRSQSPSVYPFVCVPVWLTKVEDLTMVILPMFPSFALSILFLPTTQGNGVRRVLSRELLSQQKGEKRKEKLNHSKLYLMNSHNKLTYIKNGSWICRKKFQIVWCIILIIIWIAIYRNNSRSSSSSYLKLIKKQQLNYKVFKTLWLILIFV